MSSKRTLLLTHGYPPEKGGSYNYLHRIHKNLAEKWTVLTARFPGDRAFDRKQLFKIKRSFIYTLLLLFDGRGGALFPLLKPLICPYVYIYQRTRYLRLIGHFLILIRSLLEIIIGRYDLVICGHACMPIGLVGYLSRKILRIPYIAFVYGEELTEIEYKGHRITKKLMRNVVISAERVVVCSSATGGRLLKLGVPQNRIKLVYPGVDIERFKPFKPGSEFLDKLGINGDKLMLSVGRLIERKGFDTVLDSLPDIMRSVGPVKYIIAGNGPDRKRLELKVKENGVESSVIFLDGVTDEELPALYNACDLFVMPNRIGKQAGDVEGFGMVFLEASACGKPVIGGRSGGAVEAIEHSSSGYLVHPESKDEFITAAVDILKNGKGTAYGANGLKRCRSQFTWKQSAETMRSVLDSISI
ncbi:MAG: glycosyltransferase [candidate division Zixibacteria bacterium]|nr:glycosyltransferase [candidate division Zixibacteria bacterium]